MTSKPTLETDSPPPAKKKITEREWFLPVVILGIFAPIIVGIFLYHYTAFFDGLKNTETSQADSRRGQNERNESAEIQNPAPVAEESPSIGVDSEVSNALNKMLQTYRETSQELIDNLKEQARQRKTFAYLEGVTPLNNYSVFLQKYYGLNNNPQLGDGLIESLIGQEVEWAVQIYDMSIDGEGEVAYIALLPISDVCENTNCPEDFQSFFMIHVDSDSEVIYAVKKGDFIHIRGLLTTYPPESSPDWTYRERMHVHASNFRYYVNTDDE